MHLIFTVLGIMLHLWTVYTTVVTNILGLHLALRGPEGSVDRAVRHMAQQNQFALRKFMYGLGLFILSVLFFALSEYHILISVWICTGVGVLAWTTYHSIKELVASFFLPEESTVTGQWFDAEPTPEPKTNGLRRRASVGDLGNMLAFVKNPKTSSPARPGSLRSYVPSSREDVVTGMRRVRKRIKESTSGGAMINDQATKSSLDEQVPSAIAEHLIFKQQRAANLPNRQPQPLRRHNSRKSICALQRWSSSFSGKNEAVQEAAAAATQRSLARQHSAGAVTFSRYHELSEMSGYTRPMVEESIREEDPPATSNHVFQQPAVADEDNAVHLEVPAHQAPNPSPPGPALAYALTLSPHACLHVHPP